MLGHDAKAGYEEEETSGQVLLRCFSSVLHELNPTYHCGMSISICWRLEKPRVTQHMSTRSSGLAEWQNVSKPGFAWKAQRW